jgi:hypothetical protein
MALPFPWGPWLIDVKGTNRQQKKKQEKRREKLNEEKPWNPCNQRYVDIYDLLIIDTDDP